MLIIPAPGFRCRFCMSRKCSYDLLRGHYERGQVVHRPACRVRWDIPAREVVNRDFWAWVDRQGVTTSQYGEDRPRHRFMQVIG